jgi:hypothetical protein
MSQLCEFQVRVGRWLRGGDAVCRGAAREHRRPPVPAGSPRADGGAARGAGGLPGVADAARAALPVRW